MPRWSRWRGRWRPPDDGRDRQHPRGRRGGAHAIRYAFHEHGYGFAQIHAHRVARPPGPGTKEKRIRPEILTLGRDLATVNLEFKVRAFPTWAGRSSARTSRR